MHNNYKKDERILKDIIHINIKSNDPTKNPRPYIIYYNNLKTSNMVIKSNFMSSPSLLQSSNVVYNFKCNSQNCVAEYVGQTTLTLEKRLNAHYYNGSIKVDYQQNHQTPVTKHKEVECQLL